MAVLEWHKPGEKTYHSGIDKGVYYSRLGAKLGHAWNGLIDVKDSNEGGKMAPIFVDGIVRGYDIRPGRFAGSLECYSYPEAFNVEALGNKLIDPTDRFRVTHQQVSSFDMAYRTWVGSDTEGPMAEYELHVIYNIYAMPNEKSNSTVTDSTEPYRNTFDLFSIPMIIAGGLPTSHFIIESKRNSDAVMTSIKNILYGTAGTNPRVPTVAELAA